MAQVLRQWVRLSFSFDTLVLPLSYPYLTLILIVVGEEQDRFT
jgi:hypothetical protein